MPEPLRPITRPGLFTNIFNVVPTGVFTISTEEKPESANSDFRKSSNAVRLIFFSSTFFIIDICDFSINLSTCNYFYMN